MINIKSKIIIIILLLCSIFYINFKYINVYASDNITIIKTDKIFDSELYETVNTAPNFNCYAYALGIYDKNDVSGMLPKYAYNPGNFSNLIYNENWSIEEIANAVKSDMQKLGYHDILISKNLPAINDEQRLICVGKSETGNCHDYHFMRYDLRDECWYHKPGTESSILKYKYEPSDARFWSGEYIDKNGEMFYDIIDNGTNSQFQYDGPIYYITVSESQANYLHIAGFGNLGGMTGKNNGKITSCSVNNSSAGLYHGTAGGIAGKNEETGYNTSIENCEVNGFYSFIIARQ